MYESSRAELERVGLPLDGLHYRARRKRVRALCGERVDPPHLIEHCLDVRCADCVGCMWIAAWQFIVAAVRQKMSALAYETVAKAAEGEG